MIQAPVNSRSLFYFCVPWITPLFSNLIKKTALLHNQPLFHVFRHLKLIPQFK